MSETKPQTSLVSPAKEVKAQASAWLARVNAGNWNREDQVLLDAWLAESHANRAAYWRLEAAWAQAAKLSVLHAPERENDTAGRRRRPMLMKWVAATIVVGILSAIGANLLRTPHIRSFDTGIGGHKSLTLADGSKVELNTNTVLRLSEEGGQREIWLDRGEAFFQVKHDAAHPFVVMIGSHRVIDLGTEFVIRRDDAQVKVSLVEGRAVFEQTDTSSAAQTALLVPGDVLTATANAMTVSKKPAQDLDNELAWRRGVLVFFHTTLAEAARELNRYNGRKIVIADADSARLQINGTFPANDVRLFGRVTHVVLGVNVQNSGDEVVISR